MHKENSDKWNTIKDGNIKEFEKIFKKYYNSLCNFALKLVEDPDLAEEIVQNFFVNLWLKRNEIEINNFKKYIFKSVYNNCLQVKKFYKVRENYYKNETKKNAVFTNNMYDNEFEKKYYEHEINVKINELIDKMPEKRKKIFMMSKFEGLKYEEIANILSISVKTVESNISKALKTLRKGLAKYI